MSDSDRRRHPRMELLAHAQVSSFGEVYLLRVRNASRSGVFIEGAVIEHPELQVGTELDVMVTPLEHPDLEPVAFRTRVVRVESDGDTQGFGLAIEQIDGPNAAALEALLGDAVDELGES